MSEQLVNTQESSVDTNEATSKGTFDMVFVLSSIKKTVSTALG